MSAHHSSASPRTRRPPARRAGQLANRSGEVSRHGGRGVAGAADEPEDRTETEGSHRTKEIKARHRRLEIDRERRPAEDPPHPLAQFRVEHRESVEVEVVAGAGYDVVDLD